MLVTRRTSWMCTACRPGVARVLIQESHPSPVGTTKYDQPAACSGDGTPESVTPAVPDIDTRGLRTLIRRFPSNAESRLRALRSRSSCTRGELDRNDRSRGTVDLRETPPSPTDGRGWRVCERLGSTTAGQTLKRNSTTSPSCMTYSLPSMRALPLERASAIEPASIRSSNEKISALMKPFWKSV